ncbi:MAG: (Fe-S)-binding protein [Anaerolineales bacterium]
MLIPVEKIIFILALLVTLYVAWRVVDRIIRTIGRGHGKPDWKLVQKRLLAVLAKTVSLQPTFRLRIGPSLFHAFVAWGFMLYLLVNLGDIVRGFSPGFIFLGAGAIGDLYRLLVDLLSVGVLVGMTVLIIRRFVLASPDLTTRENVLLWPKARFSIRRDSAIVGAFIMIHVGSRFLGESVRIAAISQTTVIGQSSSTPYSLAWEPFASLVSNIWSGLNPASLNIVEHIFFWLALGTILAFIPYFLYSKHIHLFFAPLNFLLKPERRSMGELGKLDFEDESIEQFGATHIEDLGWEQIMDAYACIMCYRCQQVCPAYNTGKVLSPATLEINKRYFLNYEGENLARGEPSQKALVEFAITPEAVWACTACGACVDICPVGNEPMRDILDIRRALVLMENDFPEQLQTAFRGMERTVNPWNVSPTERMKWAEGLNVPTIEQQPEPDLLWWVGCAPSTDARAQKTARAFAEILNKAGVNFAVLGEQEQCTGDSARRAGNEFLFNEMASANVEILNEVKPKRIVTTCPHCLHTLKNEYPAFGGHYEVVHHTQLINELLAEGKLKLKAGGARGLTYHDPCYLGRQNGILETPRKILRQAQPGFTEMPRHGQQSFCCGAGGAQMWKEEEAGDQRVSASRIQEAIATGAETLAVGCPFCMIMLGDAQKAANTSMVVEDVAEVVLKSLE